MDETASPALLEAAAYLSRASSLSSVPNSTKLELYGLYKFLTVSPLPQTSRPSLFDMTGRAKWDAWSNTAKTYNDRKGDAEKRYLDIARELGWIPGDAGTQVKSPSDQTSSGEVWDDELGMTVSGSSSNHGGMGTIVSALARPANQDGAETLHKLAIEGDADKISRFMEAHPLLDINKRDEFVGSALNDSLANDKRKSIIQGYTALHLACDRGNLPTAKVLLEHGGDPLLKDPDNLIAAELAEIAGHDKLSALLRQGSTIV
ncbi:acyl CoA binding protein-domain-containing protein [Pisolithus sp. B1]|nr:acyl CoA binding protein-domain-containing protein [Pisolithus sp. B1]